MSGLIEEIKLHGILDKQTRNWEWMCHHIKNIPTNPMVIITDVFKGGDLFVAERLLHEGEHVLLEAQEYWMSHLLPVLSEYFGLPDVSIQYDKDVALSPIYFIYNEKVIGTCSPYLRTFHESGVPGKSELVVERNALTYEIDELEKEMNQWTEYANNPTLMGEDNTWLFAKASLNPKKYKKLANEQVEEKRGEIEQLLQRVQLIDIQIEQAEKEFLESSYYLERIQSRVAKWGDFTFYAPELEGE